MFYISYINNFISLLWIYIFCLNFYVSYLCLLVENGWIEYVKLFEIVINVNNYCYLLSFRYFESVLGCGILVVLLFDYVFCKWFVVVKLLSVLIFFEF